MPIGHVQSLSLSLTMRAHVCMYLSLALLFRPPHLFPLSRNFMIVYGCFSGVEYTDVSAYRLSLSEDTKALNQLVCHAPFSIFVL